MFIDVKQDHTLDQKMGWLWAKEINSIVKELVSVFRSFGQPDANIENQVVMGVNYIAMSQLWILNRVDDFMYLSRRQELPTPDGTVNNLLFYVKPVTTNHIEGIHLRFYRQDESYPLYYNGELIPVNYLIPNKVYMIVFETVDSEQRFTLHDIAYEGDVVTTDRNNTLVTTEPIQIINNRIQLDDTVFGDLVFNTAHIHTVEDGITSQDYDTKEARVNPNNRKEAIIINNDDIDVNYKYAIVSYMT